MATETAPAQAAYDEWRERRWRLTGALVVLLWLAVAVLTVTLGEKRSDLGRLQSDLAAGAVSAVHVVGMTEGVAEGGTGRGFARVELHWDGWVDRYAEVVVAYPREPRTDSFNPDHLPVIVGDPGDALRVHDPDLRVTYTDVRSSPGGLSGWQGPQHVMWLVIAAWVGAILLAFNGPEPWRVTRWGWAWLVILGGPVGAGLYVLLGGPLGLGRPRRPERRLTGGWAFLLAAAIFGGVSGG